MTGVGLSGSCNSPIQSEKRDLKSCFLIILTRVKILVVFLPSICLFPLGIGRFGVVTEVKMTVGNQALI
jgi:hypothetical protein